ncbi:MAG: hypothetical protein SFZ24_02780 [Planctomycetota bacterium]|nr:hypothetical protein [Planctomycetota bacterium]
MLIRSAWAAASLAAVTGAAHAAVAPFTETFSSGNSGWTGPATWNSTGGPDGTGAVFADTNVNNAAFGVLIALRAQASSGASGGAFVGDWTAPGLSLRFSVRHNAPEPISFGARFALAQNFPGAIGLDFATVAPNTWGTVTIPITPNYPGWLSFEGSDFNTIMSSVANLQLLYAVPQTLSGTGTVVRVEADNVSIVPAPAVIALAPALALPALRRRRA